MKLHLPANFFARLRADRLFGDRISQPQVSGCEQILDACGEAGWPCSWTAYALATAFHETGRAMQPVRERGGEAYLRRRYDIEGERPEVARRLGNVTPGDGVRYAGMGYVQCTGRGNAMRVERELGAPAVDDPGVLLRPDVAAAVMIRGMAEGWFTGVSLADVLPDEVATAQQFEVARRTINGRDRADVIAGIAEVFQRALQEGGWR